MIGFKTLTMLSKDKRYFVELIDYWSLDNEHDEDHIFKITPLMRTI